MPTRTARLVTVTYGDGDIEQYRDVTVQDNVSSRLLEPETRYTSMSMTPAQRIGARSAGWEPKPAKEAGEDGQ